MDSEPTCWCTLQSAYTPSARAEMDGLKLQLGGKQALPSSLKNIVPLGLSSFLFFCVAKQKLSVTLLRRREARQEAAGSARPLGVDKVLPIWEGGGGGVGTLGEEEPGGSGVEAPGREVEGGRPGGGAAGGEGAGTTHPRVARVGWATTSGPARSAPRRSCSSRSRRCPAAESARPPPPAVARTPTAQRAQRPPPGALLPPGRPPGRSRGLRASPGAWRRR